jgi:hypothetical protein
VEYRHRPEISDYQRDFLRPDYGHLRTANQALQLGPISLRHENQKAQRSQDTKWRQPKLLGIAIPTSAGIHINRSKGPCSNDMMRIFEEFWYFAAYENGVTYYPSH